MKLIGFYIVMLSFAASCGQTNKGVAVENAAPVEVDIPASQEQGDPGFFVNAAGDTIYRIEKTAEEWRTELDANEFHILREAGTERAFTGDLLKEKRAGTFTCAACGLELFDSETKFDSGTGWPSFYQPADPAHVGEESDRSYGMVRTEVLCNRCGGHLGHVFPDGPAPTGLRYCINAASLDFEPADSED